jgi:hypothetical protein
MVTFMDITMLTDLEHRALMASIANVQSSSLRDCLMKQVQQLRVASRKDNRPYGFYTDFTCLEAVRCPGTDAELNRPPPSAWGVYGPNDMPISFLVYMKDGVIDFLEASTVISEWPESESSIEFPLAQQ